MFTYKDILPQIFFKHFASKKQLPGFCINRTLVKNGLRCKVDFDYLGLMFVCFTIGGCLEPFFRTGYHIFQRVTIRVTTHVTIRL